MKNVILALLLALVSTTAFAVDTDVTVGASTDFLYRGQSVTGDQPTVFGNARFSNLIVDGAYFSVDGVVTDLAPLNTRKTVRTEVGVGYVFDVKGVTLDLGAYRVFNPVLKTADYNELRAKATYAVSDSLSVYGQVAQITSDIVSEDLYYAGGVEYKGLFTDKLNAGLLVSGTNGEGDGHNAFNNAELYASYDIGKGFEAFGTYSVGGRTFPNEFSVNANDIPSQGMLGVRYNF